MKNIFCLSVIFLSLFFSVADIRADESAEEKIRHYDIELPKTKVGALSLMQESLDSIKKAIDEENLHAVHETSYSSEAAIKGLQKLTSDNSVVEKLKTLWQINENMHIESESASGNIAKVRDEFNKLNKSWTSLQKHFN